MASDDEEAGVHLPPAVLRHIYTFLDGQSVGALACTARAWRDAAHDEALWQLLFRQRWEDGVLPVEDTAVTSFAKRHRLDSRISRLVWSDDVAARTRVRLDLAGQAQTYPLHWMLQALQDKARLQGRTSWLVSCIEDCACSMLARVRSAPPDIPMPLLLADATCAISLLVDSGFDAHLGRSSLASLGAAARVALDAASLQPDDVVGRAKAVYNFLTRPLLTEDKDVPRTLRGHSPEGVLDVAHEMALRDLIVYAHTLAPRAPATGGGLGFGGHQAPYEKIDNSHLGQCLAHRSGLPITLAVVFIAVAHHAGVEILPVNAPGHFLCRAPPPHDLFFDIHGGGGPLVMAAGGQPAWARETPTPRAVARRMLSNIVNHARHPTEGMRDAAMVLGMHGSY